MNLPKFKIRASAVSEIMTNPKNKSELISKGAQTYCKKWLLSAIYGVRSAGSSKYTEKGIQCEDEAIEFAGAYLGSFMPEKNTRQFEDEYFTGCPDVILPEYVDDIKCSWDVFTFPLLEQEIPEQGYWMQLQIYMHLTGKKKARLVYVLMPTPEDVPQYWTSAIPDNIEELDAELRIRVFEFDYNPEFIQSVQQRVLDCRTWIETLIK